MKISIITVCYNAVAVLEQTILSVINQTYSNVEYIIIDGGSTDGTVDIIKKYSEKIAFWISEPDKGIYDAMNKGIKLASGEWLNFMNAGDSFCSDDILNIIFSKERTCDFLAGIAIRTDGSRWNPISKDFTFRKIYCGGEVCHQASFIKKELLQNGYDCSYKIIADELLFVEQILIKGKKYEPVNVEVCNFDIDGISSQISTGELIRAERHRFFQEKIPSRILLDYENYFMIMTKIPPFVKKIMFYLKRRFI